MVTQVILFRDDVSGAMFDTIEQATRSEAAASARKAYMASIGCTDRSYHASQRGVYSERSEDW